MKHHRHHYDQGQHRHEDFYGEGHNEHIDSDELCEAIEDALRRKTSQKHRKGDAHQARQMVEDYMMRKQEKLMDDDPLADIDDD